MLKPHPPFRTETMKSDSQLQQHVKADGGGATPCGTVRSCAERDLAARSASCSSGVRNVADKMNLID